MPKSSVMRFDSSPETSHSVAGGASAVLDHWIVGSDSSSATHGSSVASVAGKKRAPTKQWANACEQGSTRNGSASATAREHHGLPGMIILHRSVSDRRPRSRPARASGRQRRRSGAVGFGVMAGGGHGNRLR